jgi:transposase
LSSVTENAALGYRRLLIIERCFRSLKRTQIQMMPMYHWVSRRIGTNVEICALALLRERVAELKCGASWARIRHSLTRLQVAECRNSQHSFFMLIRCKTTAGLC